MTVIYPGYSWSISQHMGPASDSVTMFRLLQAAHKYSHAPNFQDKITEEITSLGLLTANIREDQQKPQLWRDYQQVLPELGLIVSTKSTKKYINITPIGYQWLDGAIGYSELITSQCLNYQYPNGYKTDLSPAMKKELSSNGISIPETRTELDATFGVLIRPALLILRILIQMNKDNIANGLSVMQCLVHLMPIKKNKDWGIAYNSLIKNPQLKAQDSRRLRHIQEWYRILSYTDIFEVSAGSIALTEYAKNLLPELDKYCTLLEDEATFWVPPLSSEESLKASWFNFFGNIPIERQWLRAADDMTGTYITKNYCQGIEDTATDEGIQNLSYPLALKEFDANALRSQNTTIGTYDVNVDTIIDGKIRAQKHSILHDAIVESVARKLKTSGFNIYHDKDSVDLLAVKNGSHTIIEVKTITQRNAVNRLRLGIGQLSEYRYRYHTSGNPRPHAILVCSTGANYPSWYAQFFENDLSFGLASMQTMDSFSAYTTGEVERIIAS